MTITRAYDEATGEVGPPKTAAGIRTIAIPPTLYALLKRLVRERKGGELLCPVIAATPGSLGERGVSRATVLRGFVERAGIERGAELFEQTRTHLALDFRGAIRDSGITARFLADHKAEDVQREAGHEELSTTLGYAKAVKNHRGRYGEPFPSLPVALVGADPDGDDDVPSGSSEGDATPSPVVAVPRPVPVTSNERESLRRGRDSNPRWSFSPTPA